MRRHFKTIAIAAGAALIAASLVAWAAQTNYLGAVFVADPTTPAYQQKVNSDGSTNVDTTVSVTVAGFQPSGNYATLTAGNGASSAATALPSGAPAAIVVYNNGAFPISVKLGGGGVAATANNDIIQPGGAEGLLTGSNTYIAAWGIGGTVPVVVSGGQGLAISWGGSGPIVSGVPVSSLNPLPVAKSQVLYTQSAGNTSVAQLGASATFTGTIDQIINEQIVSVNLTSDQSINLTIKQCIDASCTFVVSNFTYTTVAGVGLNRAWAINGNYVQVTTLNNSGTTATTTFNLNTYYGPAENAYSPAGNVAVDQMSQPTYGTGWQTFVSASSGNQAAAVATATCSAQSGKTNYLTGYDIEAAGATTGLAVNPTITGILGGTRTMTFVAPAGILVAAQPLSQTFNPPLQGAALNTAIAVSLPSLGVGNTNATVNAQCFYQ